MADFWYADSTDDNLSNPGNWFDSGGTPLSAVPTNTDTAYIDDTFIQSYGSSGLPPGSGVCGAGTTNIQNGGSAGGCALSGTVNVDASSSCSAAITTRMNNAGTFNGVVAPGAEVTNTGTISGGMIHTGVNNAAGGEITDGIFSSLVSGAGDVSGGKFLGNYGGAANNAAVTGGTFYGNFNNAGGTTSAGAHVNAAATISNYGSATLVLFDVVRTKVDNSLTAGTLVLPAAANVWYGSGAYGVDGTGSTPSKRASSIANCSAGNVKSGVTIDDVTGTLASGGVSPFGSLIRGVAA